VGYPRGGGAQPPHDRAPHAETRMDEQSIEFHRQVYEAYHALAAREPERVRIIDGRADRERMAEEIWRVVEPYV